MKKNKITDKEIQDWTKTISKSVEDFKIEMKQEIQEIKNQKTNLKMITPTPQNYSGLMQDFTFTNNLVYLGGKDLKKEKLMTSELKALMKKYKIVKCKAELFKNF